MGRYAEAEPLYKRAAKIVEAALGANHPKFATVLSNLAQLYEAMGRYAEAEPLYERALAITEAAHGPDHPDVAIRINNLAGLYWATGRYAEAELLSQRALAMREEALGDLEELGWGGDPGRGMEVEGVAGWYAPERGVRVWPARPPADVRPVRFGPPTRPGGACW